MLKLEDVLQRMDLIEREQYKPMLRSNKYPRFL